MLAAGLKNATDSLLKRARVNRFIDARRSSSREPWQIRRGARDSLLIPRFPVGEDKIYEYAIQTLSARRRAIARISRDRISPIRKRKRADMAYVISGALGRLVSAASGGYHRYHQDAPPNASPFSREFTTDTIANAHINA